MKFTMEEYCGGRIPTQKQLKNATKLLECVNELGKHFSDPVPLSSPKGGLRTEVENEACGGIKNSPHLTGEAIDLKDKDHKLSQFILNNLDLLRKCGLYMENPYYCVSKATGNNWIHLQIRPASQTVFKPY